MTPKAPLVALPALVSALFAGCASDQNVERVLYPPVAEITSPSGGSLYRQGQGGISVSGRVFDSADPAPSLAVVWTIDEGVAEVIAIPDEEGLVAAVFSPDDLPLGAHTVTLTVTDLDGGSGSDAVSVEVGGPMTPPDVTITAPEDGFEVERGISVTFQGEASDATDDPDALTFAWSSSLDGPLTDDVSGDGRSVLITGALAVGIHQIALTATDSDGQVGEASIVVEVLDPEKPPKPAEPGDLVFSEMMVNPEVVQDEIGEWVELYNTAGYSIDVGGYVFRDDDVDAFTLEGPLVVAPADFVVLCASLDVGLNGGVPCDGWFLRDSQGGGLALANGPDELVLARPDGVEIDWLHYDDAWYLPGIALGLDPSHYLAESNDDPSHWCQQTTVMVSGGEPGTPGAPNDPCP